MKLKKGDFVYVKEKAYRHIEYHGVVTEVFKDLVQVYGDGYKPLGFYEFDPKEIRIRIVEKEKISFIFSQALRSLEQKKISAEIKFKALESEISEARQIIEGYLK